MKFKSLQKLALVSSAVLGMAIPAAVYAAAPNADVTIDITTDAGITATNLNDIDFGTWIIGVHTGDTPTIVMPVATGTMTKTTGVGSDLLAISGTAGVLGQIKVTLPTGADGLTLQMQRAAVTQFADTNIQLTAVTYKNSDNVAQTGTLAAVTNVPIDVTVGATGATVSFGGTITATATPADNLAHNASFVVTFSF